jgi:hypothetical protein
MNDTTKNRSTLAIDPDLHQQIKLMAVMDRATVQETTEKIIRAGLAAVAQQPGPASAS